MKKKLRNTAIAVCVPAMIFGLGACHHGSDPAPTTGGLASAPLTNRTALLASVSLTVLDSQGGLVYSDQISSTAQNLIAGSAYDLKLAVTNLAAGTTFTMQATRTDIPGQAMLTKALVVGDNSFTFPAQGEYDIKVVIAQPGAAPMSKAYVISVSCAHPSFSPGSLNGNGIAVTSTGTNLYAFNSSAAVAGADGMAPFTCAWDITGTGIIDTQFGPCGSAVSNRYVSYVGSRKIGLIVKDSCNTTQIVTKTVNLGDPVPAMPGNVFISGEVSGAQGVAASDPRIANVTYLATNAGGNNIVQPKYASGGFNINAMMTYNKADGNPSGVNFGMQISLKGITDNISLANGTTDINVSNAYIDKVLYSTDQDGDELPPVTFTDVSCTLANQGAQVKVISGTPCASNGSGGHKDTIEIWGTYTCAMTSSSGTMNITGNFDGYDTWADNCSGGGGGGGGNPPLQF